jgi:NitT/TauT family transport system substrate-binding protein
MRASSDTPPVYEGKSAKPRASSGDASAAAQRYSALSRAVKAPKLAPTRIRTSIFRAGPRVTEALLGDAIDAGTAGPAAIVVHHVRHTRGDRSGLRVLGGCASGGASLVVRRGSRIASADDLHGKRLAVTQIGTGQDVSLKTYLRTRGLRPTTAGGDVSLVAISTATILEEMRRGRLDGAWLAEPWATRLCDELGAIRLVDERDLWPERRFATAVLATVRARAHDPRIHALARALSDEVDRAVRAPEAIQQNWESATCRSMISPVTPPLRPVMSPSR